MKSTTKFKIMVAMVPMLLATPSHAQTDASPVKPESPVIVDKVVTNPEEFKGTISVIGRVAKQGENEHLFALSCEDACFSMPVRFAGTAPKSGTDVVVRGQLSKDPNGRYIFVAESVTPRK